MRRRSLLASLPAALSWPLAASAAPAPAAAAYPSQAIRLLVPFPPAGGTDVVARLMGDKVHQGTGWNFVVDNRAGAGGNIGMDAAAKSPADGYTLALGQTANLAINPALYPKMPYDAAKAFVPVAMVAAQPVVLVVRAEAPWKTLAELVAAAKAKPGTLTMASAGNGTVGHLTGEAFRKRAGIDFIHVPYKGAGPAATDLLGGQVDFYFATPQAIVGFVKTGKLRALGVSLAKRVQVLPDVPTIAESGYAGFETYDWKMLVAPAGTPADVVSKLNAAVDKAMSQPQTISLLLTEGSVPMTGSPADAAKFLKAEQARWGGIVRDGKIHIE